MQPSSQLLGGVRGCGGGNLGCLNLALLVSPVCVVALLSSGLGLLIDARLGRLKLDTSIVLLLLPPVEDGSGVPDLEYGVLAPLLLPVG